MIRPIININDLENKIINFAKNNENILVLLRYGSKLDGSFDLLSDLDFFIITNDIIKLKHDLSQLNPMLKLDYDNYSVLYFEYTNQYTDIRKVDIKYSSDINNISKYLKEKDDLSNVVIIDKIKITTNCAFEIKKKKISDLYNYHINRFIETFEYASISRQSSDRYRYLFYQNIALQHLYTLIYMINGYYDFDYLPKQLVNSINQDDLQLIKNEFDPDSNLHISNIILLNILNKFEKIMKRIYDKYPYSEIPQSQITILLRKIIQRDKIWNIRDIADINTRIIKNNILIRSSYLSKYIESNLFYNFIHDFKIKSIIDIRNSKEVNTSPYPDLDLNYYNIPIGSKHVYPHELKYTEIGIDPFFYEYFPRHYLHEIKQIFLTILNSPKPAVIHCVAGKDRTGIIVAMLHKLIGLSDNEIIMDYLSSRSDTKRIKIQITLKVIEEFGGIMQYLQYAGLTETEINSLILLFKIQ